MINWCPRCQTALSDLEVEHKDIVGHLYYIRYPLTESEGFVTVATTRPETFLGDTAIAVNPTDKRYKNLLGKNVTLPIIDKEIPIIADDAVDTSFGTGALKITPAHDPTDLEVAQRHNLPLVDIMNPDATMNENAGPYQGLERFACRDKVLADLKDKKLLEKIEPYSHSVGHCGRCQTMIEPKVSLQWFVQTQSLAKAAIEAVKDSRVTIIPERFTKIYFDWMENIRDWCISRQLWWGHRIPVWYCKDCDEMTVSEESPARCLRCGSSNMEQDKDVLDTWFSSCLWPFAVFGWPEESDELKYCFPTSVLVTAHDIIFFWVARMMMMSLYFKKDVPFREVFINPIVNDEYGQKMSKSKGNVVDPMEVIGEKGSDVLRFTLTSLTTPGRNLILGDEKIEGIRNFVNKLWNASKFVISNLGETADIRDIKIEKLDLNLWDRWILFGLNRTVRDVEKYMGKYNFSFASRLLSDFFWNEYCDWYIESAKVRIYSAKSYNDRRSALFILWYVLESYLRLLHPFMPFITEMIWQNIPHKGESIMVKSFPEFDPERVSRDAENKIGVLFDVISEIRKIRSELKINPADRVKVNLAAAGRKEEDILEKNKEYIYSLGKVSEMGFKDCTGQKGYIKTAVRDIDIFIYILDVVDIKLEISRIKNQIVKIKKAIEKSKKKVSSPDFNSKAPAEIIQKEKDRLDQAEKTLKILDDQLTRIEDASK